MYLEKAKERFQELLRLAKRPVYQDSCTVEDIQAVQQRLNLLLPKAYEELLLWIGQGSSCTAPIGLGHYSRNDTNLQEIALQILEMMEASERLPEDAIVFVIFDEASSFAFIQAFEGNDPPVHYFPGVRQGEDGKYYDDSHIHWNWFPNLDAFCVDSIDAYIDMGLLRTTPIIHPAPARNEDA